ncbi:MAG: 16S rRNA (guanine(527)-N(7))-methyltransferase RsmG [Gaiellales bacterium]
MKHPCRAALQRYCELLTTAPVSVTAARGTQALWETHVADALTALPLILEAPPCSMIDVGSGGGSPGIPLAIAADLSGVTLLEATARKAEFLRGVVAELELDAIVVNERSEIYGRGPGREQHDLAVARALAPPAVALELCLPLVGAAGRLILWVGAVDSAELARVAVRLGGRLERTVPTGRSRRLLVFEKVAPTPDRFPRRPGMAAKRPLPPIPSTA